MKRCPTCKRLFSETNLSFCTDDGTPLAEVEDANEETVVNTSASNSGEPARPAAMGGGTPPAYQPPSYTPMGQPARRRVWPWVVGILALVLILVVGLGIAAAVFVPSMLRAAANENSKSSRDNRPANQNRAGPNSNTNSNLSPNTNSTEDKDDGEDENSAPPTSQEEVLAQLTDLENDWTVANINADKKKLDRILADDYVGQTSEGKPQGKAEYLKTIERDNSIQKWNFEDLKATLLGDRATLAGIIRLQINDKEAVFKFTDKFVWRDGRWQATTSEVAPLNGEAGQ